MSKSQTLLSFLTYWQFTFILDSPHIDGVIVEARTVYCLLKYLLLSEVHDLPVEERVVLLQSGHGRLRGDVAVGPIGRSLLGPVRTTFTAGVHLQRNSWMLKQSN